MSNKSSAYSSEEQQNKSKGTNAAICSLTNAVNRLAAAISPTVNQNMESPVTSEGGKTEERNEVKLAADVKPEPKSNGEKTALADSKIHIIPGLNNAIRKKCWKDCLKLLKKNIGVNSPEVKQLQYVKEYKHLMDTAFQKGYKDLILLFIYNGYPVNEVVYGSELVGNPLLFLSIKYNILEYTHILLDKNVNVNCRSITGERPVHTCAEKGNISLMELLLSKGATLDVKDNSERSALHSAITGHHFTEDHFNMVKLLLEKKKIDIDLQDKDGRSVLHYAVLDNQYDLVKLLLENDADTDLQDFEGNTALHKSIEKGYENIFTLLHKGGASINSRNNKGETPLIVAVKNKHASLVKNLLNDPYCDTEATFTANGTSFTASSYAHCFRIRDIINLFVNVKK